MGLVNRVIKLTRIEDNAGPYYDIYASLDCQNYILVQENAYLPTTADSASLYVDSQTECFRLVNKSTVCLGNEVVKENPELINSILISTDGFVSCSGTCGAELDLTLYYSSSYIQVGSFLYNDPFGNTKFTGGTNKYHLSEYGPSYRIASTGEVTDICYAGVPTNDLILYNHLGVSGSFQQRPANTGGSPWGDGKLFNLVPNSSSLDLLYQKPVSSGSGFGLEIYQTSSNDYFTLQQFTGSSIGGIPWANDVTTMIFHMRGITKTTSNPTGYDIGDGDKFFVRERFASQTTPEGLRIFPSGSTFKTNPTGTNRIIDKSVWGESSGVGYERTGSVKLDDARFADFDDEYNTVAHKFYIDGVRPIRIISKTDYDGFEGDISYDGNQFSGFTFWNQLFMGMGGYKAVMVYNRDVSNEELRFIHQSLLNAAPYSICTPTTTTTSTSTSTSTTSTTSTSTTSTTSTSTSTSTTTSTTTVTPTFYEVELCGGGLGPYIVTRASGDFPTGIGQAFKISGNSGAGFNGTNCWEVLDDAASGPADYTDLAFGSVYSNCADCNTTTTTSTSTTTSTTTQCQIVQTVTLNVSVAGTFDFVDGCGVNRSTSVPVDSSYVVDYSTDGCIDINTFAGTAEYTVVSYGPCCTPNCTTTTTSTSTSTTTSTTTLGCYSCNDGTVSLATGSNSQGTYPDREVCSTSDTCFVFNWVSFDRPNKFSVYDSNGLVWSTSTDFGASNGWVGYANYAGPWGASLNTVTNGYSTIQQFTSTSGRYVRVEYGAADTPPNNISDAAEWNMSCQTCPTTTTTSTTTLPTLYSHGAVRGTCSDYCTTNYLIQTITSADASYSAISIGDTIYGGFGAGYIAISDTSTDTNTGPFKIAEIDSNGVILDILVCSGGSCVPL